MKPESPPKSPKDEFFPPILSPRLKLVIVGFNPGAVSAAQGHFYAKPGNQFYPLLFESGLTPRLLRPEEDRRLPTWGVGLADLCPWKAGQSNVLTPNDIRRGRLLLLERLKYYQPRMVAFNGLTLFKLVFGRTPKLGLQPEKIGTASLFVLLSTSGLVNGRWIERQALFADLADKVRALHLNA